MSYLQHGHVEKSFYKRSDKSYLPTNNDSFLKSDSQSYVTSPSDAVYLTFSNDAFLNRNNDSFLSPTNTSFVSRSTDSYMTSNTESFVQISQISYLDSVAPIQNGGYLLTDNIRHVMSDNAKHLTEGKQNHLEESGGETSDEENEDFSHTIDWGLIVPPFITPIFDNGATKYKCQFTNKIFHSIPVIPERFDVFDYDKQELIVTISRYHITKNGIDGKNKYRELQRKYNELHSTELQSLALENLRVWKHKKEQELLGQVNIQNADYSERTERMGVGDHSSEGAAERKRRRELLKQKQEQQRRQQMSNKQMHKQFETRRQQQEIIQKQRLAQQRKVQQQTEVNRNMSRRQLEEEERQRQRARDAEQKQQFINEQSRYAQQRKQQNTDAMVSGVNAQREQELLRKQQRDRYLEEKDNYVRVGQKQISQQRKQEMASNMNYSIEQKYSEQASNRNARRDEHNVFLDNIAKSAEDNRRELQQQRSAKIAEQERERKRKEREMESKRQALDAEAKRKENERKQKMEIKNFVTRINNLLDVKSVGIDFDEFPNEYYFKYNSDWNPQRIMGLSDLDRIFRSNGLSSTVEVLRGGMTKRAILRKHYQKIKIVSNNTNDILTVLAISENIDAAIRQMRQMINTRENKRKEQERSTQKASALSSTPYGGSSFSPQTNYSANNNWGLPRGYRVKKTAKGRLFYINDATKATSWDDPRPLPRGWRSGKTPQGRVFFISDQTKQTSWNDPRPKIHI